MPQPISTAPLNRPVMTEFGPAMWLAILNSWVLCYPNGNLLSNKFESHLDVWEALVTREIDPHFWEEIPEWMKNPPRNSSPFNADDWVFELSSGFNGYRNKSTGEWIYENEFLWRASSQN